MRESEKTRKSCFEDLLRPVMQSGPLGYWLAESLCIRVLRMAAKASSQIPVALSMKKKGQLVSFLNFISEFIDSDCGRLNPSPSITR